MGDPVTLVLISTVAHNVYETQNTFIALASYATGPSAIDDDSIKAPWDDPFMVLMFRPDVDGIHYLGIASPCEFDVIIHRHAGEWDVCIMCTLP